MVFNKKVSIAKKHKLFLSKKRNRKKNNTYLGFTFTSGGKKRKGIENLLKKASKAWFGIQILFKSKKERHLTLIYI